MNGGIKTVDYVFIAGALFAITVFMLTIYGTANGYIESNPLLGDQTPRAITAIFGGVWGVLLMIHLVLREKPWLNIGYVSMICGIPMFDMLNDMAVLL